MPLRDDLLNPIAGPNPSGENLRYDPIYDKIKEARREDLELPQGDWQTARKLADYALTAKLAGEVIATKSKDLQLAVWLADALLHREGLATFVKCLDFLRSLLEQFWDTLYPELEDGDAELRAAPLDWLGARMDEPVRAVSITSNGLNWFKYKESRATGYEQDEESDARKQARQQAIDEGKITAEEFDAAADATPMAFYQKLYGDLGACLACVDSLGQLCDEKFGDVAPGFGKLHSALEEVTQTVKLLVTKKRGSLETAADKAEEVEETPAAEAPVPSYEPAAAAPKKARAPAAQAVGLEPASREEAMSRLAAVARFLRQEDEYNIAPYLILRGLRWGELRYGGANIDAALLEVPPPEIRTELKRLALEQQWKEVIEAAERAMELPCGRAWLDLQRYVVHALGQMGDWYKEIATAIRTELRGLLTDLPQLLDMTLLDDTPVANAETLAWIRSEVLTGAAVPHAVQAEPQPEPEVEEAHPPAEIALEGDIPSMDEEQAVPEGELVPPDAFELAMQAASQGREVEAIEILSRELAQERSGRGRFKRRMQLAHICMAAGHDNVALPILEELATEIDGRRLEEWEAGEVLAYPLVLLLRCVRSLDSGDQKKQQIYSRICRLDPRQALSCSR